MAVSHYPAREEHKEAVQALLPVGTDVAKRDAQNRTPARAARDCRYKDLARLIKERPMLSLWRINNACMIC